MILAVQPADALPALDSLVRIAYLLAAVTFVLGLRFMRSPVTARLGNTLSASGMGLAVLATFALLFFGSTGPVRTSGSHLLWGSMALIAGIVAGSVAGLVGARRVQMTAMPQLVSVFNAVGGGAAAIVALVEFLRLSGSPMSIGFALPVGLDVVIGAVTFSGSLLAAGKLQGWVTGTPLTFPGSRVLTVSSAVLALAGTAWLVVQPSGVVLVLIAVLALAFGILMVLPIGGADMPVVVSLLNAFTGLAVAMAGFVVNNQIMIIAGALVGAAGTILTLQMAEAMNRSVWAIMVGGFGTGANQDPQTPSGAVMPVRKTEADDVAVQLAYASKVIIVPGYGLAAAQAQRECGELGGLLAGHGITVHYAVHPVAGRMPGHMNVLLAEADVPYDQLKEMDEVNSEFASCDVALVVGANDVINPAARRPGNAISGMPILNVDHAPSVVVVKRSLGHGYAGLDNELFSGANTTMLFADAKKGLSQILTAVKAYVS